MTTFALMSRRQFLQVRAAAAALGADGIFIFVVGSAIGWNSTVGGEEALTTTSNFVLRNDHSLEEK